MHGTQRIATILLTALLALAGTGTAGAAPEIVIKGAHTVATGNSQHTPWAKFKEAVERESRGRIRVEIYPNAMLGSDNAIMEKVQMGVLQMGHASSSNLANIMPEWGVFELPYLVTDTLDNMKLFYENGRPGGPIFARLDRGMRSKGLKMLWISPASFRGVGLNTPGLRRPDQLKGKKIRCTASSVERDVLSAFGANPVAMGFGEVYTALQQKTIDGEGLPSDLMYDSKHHEVIRSVVQNKYNVFFLPVSMNAAYYDSLPPRARRAVDKAALEAVAYANEMWVKMLNEKNALMAEAGVEMREPTPEEWTLWETAARPVVNAHTARLGKAWVDEVRARLAR